MAKIKNPFSVRFTRTKEDSLVVYTTYFWIPNGDVQSVVTKVDEAKAAADGLDTPQIVAAVKGDHYNKITGLLHDALVKTLNVEAV